MVKKEIILPEEFKEEHSSTEYLQKLIGKRVHFWREGYTTDKITGLSAIQSSVGYPPHKHPIERLEYEVGSGMKFRLDWIIVVMLIEGGYAQDAIGYKYNIVE